MIDSIQQLSSLSYLLKIFRHWQNYSQITKLNELNLGGPFKLVPNITFSKRNFLLNHRPSYQFFLVRNLSEKSIFSMVEINGGEWDSSEWEHERWKGRFVGVFVKSHSNIYSLRVKILSEDQVICCTDWKLSYEHVNTDHKWMPHLYWINQSSLRLDHCFTSCFQVWFVYFLGVGLKACQTGK